MAKRNKKYKKTIFITGGAGFIGSTYLNICAVRYPSYHFINIDSLTYAGDLKNIEVSHFPNYSFEKIDIRDLKALKKVFGKYKPTGIIHFAAESHVDVSIVSPALFVETNVVGTHNLLSLALKYGLNRFHYISTDEVYGSLKTRKGLFTEQSLLEPNSPYSASKTAADVLVRAYYKTYGLNTVITRCSNNYGPRQDKTKFMPVAILALLRGRKIPLYSKGENIRDWLYVDDHVEAIDKVFHHGKPGEVYNIGGTSELTNLAVAKKIVRALKKKMGDIKRVADRPGHDFRYGIDSSKIRKELKWSPKVSFDKGLEKTISYYEDNASKKS